jgi:hypothetical protein
MKKYIKRARTETSVSLCLAVLALLSMGNSLASAAVIDVSDVVVAGSSYRAFQDTTTGLVWLDLDNFFFDNTATYNSIVILLAGSGFHLASITDLLLLTGSIPAVPANFNAEAVVVGANYAGSPHATGTRSLMWGIYEDGNSADGVSYVYRFGSSTFWNMGSNLVSATAALNSVNSTDSDLGAWIVADAAEVPEPVGAALVGLGLAWAALLRRKRTALP